MYKDMIPENWSVVTVSDVGITVTGNTPPTKDKSNYGEYLPYIKPPQLKNEPVGSSEEFLSEKGASLARVLPVNAILVSCIGNLGRTALNTVPVAFNQQINAIIPSDGILPKFIFYQTQSPDFRSQLEEKATATTISIVNKGNFEKITLNLAPLDEQRRIVAKIEALFSELDKGVESLKTAREQLKIYRQAVLKHAFEGKLTARWRVENADKLESPEQLLACIQQERETRYQQQLQEWKATVKAWEKNGKEGKKPSKPKHKEISKLSAEELSLLPKLPPGYFYTYLSNLGELGRGKSKHRPRNAPELFGGKYPFIQTGEVKAANRAIKTYSQTYNETGLAQSHLWPKGTLCITIAANIAETAFLGIDACFPDSVVGFTALESVVLPGYVDFFIKAVRVQIEAYAPATAQKNINLATLENLVIPLCSVDEQRCLVDKIEALLSVADKNEAEIELALRRAKTLRQAILKKAFTGNVVTL